MKLMASNGMNPQLIWQGVKKDCNSMNNEICGINASAGIPDSKDILLGRGKGIELHQGNEWLQCIIKQQEQMYSKERWGNKQKVVRSIINLAYNQGRRFLRLNKEGAWEDASEEVLMAKLAQAFRHKRRNLKRSGARQKTRTQVENKEATFKERDLHGKETCSPMVVPDAASSPRLNSQTTPNSELSEWTLMAHLIEPTPLRFGSVANQKKNCMSMGTSLISNLPSMTEGRANSFLDERLPSPTGFFAEPITTMAHHQHNNMVSPTSMIEASEELMNDHHCDHTSLTVNALLLPDFGDPEDDRLFWDDDGGDDPFDQLSVASHTPQLLSDEEILHSIGTSTTDLIIKF